ncbi:MAG: hypothetical protein LCH67_08245 [Bacteroidetes bacterium]|nr:hypothetical protein [Bacteroidota bacterium]
MNFLKMACNHKFLNELTLDNLDYKPTTLIVGTFNPSLPETNQAEWFYGRTHDEHGNQNNNFWDVLPRLYQEESLINATPMQWKTFCRNKKIAITDLISSIQDADPNTPNHINILKTYSDKEIATKFNQQIPVDIVQLLIDNPSIENVYLTRGTGETFWRRLWNPVLLYANNNNIYEARLLTPSGYAFYQQGKYNRLHPDNPIPNLADFILSAWSDVWHQIN